MIDMKQRIFLRQFLGLQMPVLMVVIFSILSCNRMTPSVGLFVYNENDPYITVFAQQIMKEAEGKIDVTLFYADNSQVIQNEQIDHFIETKPDLVFVNPVDRLGSFAIIHRLKNENIPAIFFNREPLPIDLALWDKVWYVGARAEQSGQLQASLVMGLFGDNPLSLNAYDRNRDGIIQTIILKGEQGHQDAETRTSEVQRSFENAGFKIEILAIEVANWSGDEAYSRMGRLLALWKDSLELVIANNDDMAIGAIARMRQNGLFQDDNDNGKIDRNDTTWIPVVGIDGIAEAEASIANGYLYGTVRNDSKKMAEIMIHFAENLFQGHTPKDIYVDKGKYIWIDYQPYISQ